MALPSTVKWYEFVIYLGDGATPTEAFVAPCGLISKGITFTGTPVETNLTDCDNPAGAAWPERTIQTLSAAVSGSGTLALESIDLWRDWFFSAAAKNIRVAHDIGAPDGGWYAMSGVLTTFEETGNQGDGVVNLNVEIQSSRDVTWVPTTP